MTAKAPRVKCTACDVEVTKSNLNKHIRNSHMNMKAVQWDCQLCDKKFTTKGGLKKHKVVVHVKRELHCSFCDKVFYVSSVLKKHIEGIHKNIQHECMQCGKVYKQKGDLNGHIRAVHQAMKAYCMFCGKEFLRSVERNRHERTVHKDELATRDCELATGD